MKNQFPNFWKGWYTNYMDKKRVYSGIRATGRLHLGNYLGAVKGMLALQDTYDCVFSVVDLHAITTPYDPKTLQQNIREVVLDFLAAGLDPKKCLLEIQSKVPQHTELSFLLATIYPLSRVEDLPTFKEKKVQHPKYVNVGLLYYPILMAADILLYKAEVVPAGVDQEPHIEVTREIARRFNQMFPSPPAGGSGQVVETFPQTHRVTAKSDYVPSLSGGGKMSKTVEGSFINLTDDLETIKKRLAAAPTDSGVVGGEVPKEGGVANLFILLKLFVDTNVYNKFVRDYRDKKIRYTELKSTLADAIYKELQPLQERRAEFAANPKMVDEILEASNAKCRELAEETMIEVRQKMGLV